MCFEQIIRLAVGFHRDERQVRVSVLQKRTGYGSDKTVRLALAGLERKGVIRCRHENLGAAGSC